MAALSADERIRHVLAVVPDVLRADRPPSAALPRITDLVRTVFAAERVGATLLEDDGTLGAMNFAGIPRQATAAHGPSRPERALFSRLAGTDRVLRIDDVASHPVLGDTQEIRKLLVIPLCAGRRSIGLLYVADPLHGGPFTPEDEALAQALGATIGSALANSALLRDALRDRSWMRAANAMTRDLFSDNVDEPLRLISDRARELGEADMVLMLLRDGDSLRVRYARGLGAENQLVGAVYPLSENLAGRVMASGQSLIIPDLTSTPHTVELRRVGDVQLGPALFIPLHGAHEVLGALILCRHEGARRFTQADLETAGTFADHAAVSLELAGAREVAEKLRMLEDRNRIARDLHDHVIQRLYAAGMTLQQVLSKVDDGARARIEVGIATLDDTIRQIRNTILTLRTADEIGYTTLGTLVDTIAREAAPLLGFPPLVALEAPVQEISGQLAADLAACVREGLSNIVRHARAEAVELRGSIHAGELCLVLKDDGIGIRSTRRSGLDNLNKRVQQHGGTLEITSPSDGGAQLTWRVPLPRAG